MEGGREGEREREREREGRWVVWVVEGEIESERKRARVCSGKKTTTLTRL